MNTSSFLSSNSKQNKKNIYISSTAVLLDETFFRTCVFECGINVGIDVKLIEVLECFIFIKIR